MCILNNKKKLNKEYNEIYSANGRLKKVTKRKKKVYFKQKKTT